MQSFFVRYSDARSFQGLSDTLVEFFTLEPFLKVTTVV